MSKKTKSATESCKSTGDFATALIQTINDQVKTLIAKNWPDVQAMLADQQEIDLSLKVSIIDRIATPGEQADKDNRVRTTISFAKKFSDNIEGALPDPDQQQLGV